MIVENTAALRLYEKLGFAHVRDVEVWTLPGHPDDAPLGVAAGAHDWIRERRREREPWQRADETVAKLGELDPAPHGVLVEGAAALVRVNAGRVAILQLAAENDEALRALLAAVQGLGESAVLLNLPAGDPAGSALRELGGSVNVRQHEMVLELGCVILQLVFAGACIALGATLVVLRERLGAQARAQGHG